MLATCYYILKYTVSLLLNQFNLLRRHRKLNTPPAHEIQGLKGFLLNILQQKSFISIISFTPIVETKFTVTA